VFNSNLADFMSLSYHAIYADKLRTYPIGLVTTT